MPYESRTGDIMEPIRRHRYIAQMILLAVAVVSLLLAGTVLAGNNLYYKAALHIAPHEERTCEAGWPEIADCTEINTVFPGCDDFDVFPVFFDLAEARRLEYGLSWPAQWGDCVFMSCAGDHTTGSIVSTGDGIAHEWDQCHQAEVVVTGYAWFSSPVAPGQLILIPNPQTGFLGATDCDGTRDFAIGLAVSGVCGIPGDNPCDCGCASEPRTWSELKSMFR